MTEKVTEGQMSKRRVATTILMLMVIGCLALLPRVCYQAHTYRGSYDSTTRSLTWHRQDRVRWHFLTQLGVPQLRSKRVSPQSLEGISPTILTTMRTSHELLPELYERGKGHIVIDAGTGQILHFYGRDGTTSP